MHVRGALTLLTLTVAVALVASACSSLTNEAAPEPAPTSPAPRLGEPARDGRPPRVRWPGVARGVAWDANWSDRANWYGTEGAEKGLDKLGTLGVSWIAVTPFSFQPDVTEPEIRFRTTWSDDLDKDVHNAHRRGMKVMVKPHIWSNQFWDGSGRWRGSIKMDSDAQWQRWFDGYQSWIVAEARQAQRLGADAFCVGLEYLESSRAHADRWRRVIRAVREVYDGPLVYAAHPSEVDLPFWDDLDAIGINAYYSLTGSRQPTSQELVQRWQTLGEQLAKVARHYDRKIVFTEVGYASVDGAAKMPSRWPTASDREDQHEQADCYRALFEVAPSWDWFGGMFIWKYKITVPENNAAERHYVFQGKPAEGVIAQGFGKRFAAEL